MIARRRLMAWLMGAGLPLLAAGGARARSNQYFYDTLGRLVSVTYPNGVTVTYVYDAAGNRVSRHAGGAPPPPPPPPPPLLASASPTSLYGDAEYPTALSAVTVSGGVSPYVFGWQRVSGSAAISVVSPTASATTWSYAGPVVPPDKIAYWRCKVTDAASTVVYSNQVVIRMVMG